jgi:cell division protein FtsW (lipid II flippase)
MGDDNRPRLTSDGKFVLALILCIPVVLIGFLIFGEPQAGAAICISAAVIVLALRATWSLHRHLWYWCAVALSAALQAPVAIYAPWTNHAYRGTFLTAFALLEYVIVWGCIKIFEKAFVG